MVVLLRQNRALPTPKGGEGLADVKIEKSKDLLAVPPTFLRSAFASSSLKRSPFLRPRALLSRRASPWLRVSAKSRALSTEPLQFLQ